MKMGWVLLAEGIAQDSRNAISLIGVGQNIQPATRFPISTKRAILANVEFDEDVPAAGQKYTVRFTMTSPSGQTILAYATEGTYVESPWQDITAGISVMGEFQITLTEYGCHVMSVDVASESHGTVRGSVNFYVAKPPGNLRD